MLLQKTFHSRHNLDGTKSALANVQAYRPQLPGVHKAVLTEEGVGQLDCELPGGFRAHCVLVELPTEDPNHALFKTTAGNVDVTGLIEFIPIRENLTEVRITLDYAFRSAVLGLVDTLAHSAEHFLAEQLEKIESWLGTAHELRRTPGSGGHRTIAHLPLCPV